MSLGGAHLADVDMAVRAAGIPGRPQFGRRGVDERGMAAGAAGPLAAVGVEVENQLREPFPLVHGQDVLQRAGRDGPAAASDRHRLGRPHDRRHQGLEAVVTVAVLAGEFVERAAFLRRRLAPGTVTAYEMEG